MLKFKNDTLCIDENGEIINCKDKSEKGWVIEATGISDEEFHFEFISLHNLYKTKKSNIKKYTENYNFYQYTHYPYYSNSIIIDSITK